jgi:methionine-rich copper-binding protein CopC
MKKILSFIATLSLSLAAIIGAASPASAHNDELKTSPAQGETVEAGRIPITLTFGEELLTGDDSISHEVIVTNAAGEIVPALCASAEGFDLSTASAIDQPGKYTVTWRTVSADGHPVDGTFDFTVENNTDYDAASDPVDACVYAMLTSGEEPTLLNSPIEPRDAENSESWPGALFIGAGFIGVLAVIGIATRKTIKDRVQRRKNKSE